MANFLLRLDQPGEASSPLNDSSEKAEFRIGRKSACTIFGRTGTYNVLHDGEDSLISIGYVSFIESPSAQAALSGILRDFRESSILDLKKKLIGEFVLLVKKGGSLYVFTDCLGVRNVFYSASGLSSSSSLSLLEDEVKIRPDDLDDYKLMEYLAMRHVLYPAWLGRSTYNKRIHWLLPYEYLAIDLENSNLRVNSVVYDIDNRKESDCPHLATELLSALTKIMARPEFKDAKIASSLTGGHDSRLVSAVARQEFSNLHLRTSVSHISVNSRKDIRIAGKIARKLHIPHDIYRFQPGLDDKRFVDLTEGMAPEYNQTIAPLLDAAGDYALGFGGAFGTELFMPIAWTSFAEYVQEKIRVAQRFLRVDESYWEEFRRALDDQIRSIREHYKLAVPDEQDEIRLFYLLDTARYGSFILSAFNHSGYHIDPYGTFPVLSLAFRVSPSLWGNHRKLGGNGLVQKSAMSKINRRMGKVLTHMHSRPMLPLTPATFFGYLLGYSLQLAQALKSKVTTGMKRLRTSPLPRGTYLSDGWEGAYLKRTMTKYGWLIADKDK
jgi:hypothetical protein